MSDVAASFPDYWKKPPLIKNPTLRWGLILGFAIYLALALGTMDVNWQRAWEGLPRGKRFIVAFFPPDFSDSRNVVWDGILESIWMAIIATVAGIALSVPVGLGAASNLAPKWVYLLAGQSLPDHVRFQR